MFTGHSIVDAIKVSSADFLVQNFGSDWLSNMHEINLPEDVSWLTVTPFSVGVVFLLVLFFLSRLWRYYVAWCDKLYRRQALQQLQLLTELWRAPAERVAAVQGLAQLVRQVALSAWPSVNVVSLLGDEWLHFLSASTASPEIEAEIAAEIVAEIDKVPSIFAELSHLTKARVEQISEAQWQELMCWTERWICHHRVVSAEFYGAHDAGL